MRPYSVQVLLDFVEPLVVELLDPLLFVLTEFETATTVAVFDPLFVCAVVAVTWGWWIIEFTPLLLTRATTVAPWSSELETGKMTCAWDSSV